VAAHKTAVRARLRLVERHNLAVLQLIAAQPSRVAYSSAPDNRLRRSTIRPLCCADRRAKSSCHGPAPESREGRSGPEVSEGTRTSNDRVQQRNMGDSLSLSRRGHKIKRSTSSPPFASLRAHRRSACRGVPCVGDSMLHSNYERLTTPRKPKPGAWLYILCAVVIWPRSWSTRCHNCHTSARETRNGDQACGSSSISFWALLVPSCCSARASLQCWLIRSRCLPIMPNVRVTALVGSAIRYRQGE